MLIWCSKKILLLKLKIIVLLNVVEYNYFVTLCLYCSSDQLNVSLYIVLIYILYSPYIHMHL